MKQLNLNQLRLVRGAEGSGGGDGVIPPKNQDYRSTERGSGGGGGVIPPSTRSNGSGGGDGVEPPKANVAP